MEIESKVRPNNNLISRILKIRLFHKDEQLRVRDNHLKEAKS